MSRNTPSLERPNPPSSTAPPPRTAPLGCVPRAISLRHFSMNLSRAFTPLGLVSVVSSAWVFLLSLLCLPGFCYLLKSVPVLSDQCTVCCSSLAQATWCAVIFRVRGSSWGA